jgi:hypothetical protein
MKKILGILFVLGSLGILLAGGSDCISGTASKQGAECYLDASLMPIIIILVVTYLFYKKKL